MAMATVTALRDRDRQCDQLRHRLDLWGSAKAKQRSPTESPPAMLGQVSDANARKADRAWRLPGGVSLGNAGQGWRLSRHVGAVSPFNQRQHWWLLLERCGWKQLGFLFGRARPVATAKRIAQVRFQFDREIELVKAVRPCPAHRLEE